MTVQRNHNLVFRAVWVPEEYGFYSCQYANIVSTTDYVSIKIDVCKKNSILIAIVCTVSVSPSTIKYMHQCHRLQVSCFPLCSDASKNEIAEPIAEGMKKYLNYGGIYVPGNVSRLVSVSSWKHFPHCKNKKISQWLQNKLLHRHYNQRHVRFSIFFPVPKLRFISGFPLVRCHVLPAFRVGPRKIYRKITTFLAAATDNEKFPFPLLSGLLLLHPFRPFAMRQKFYHSHFSNASPPSWSSFDPFFIPLFISLIASL